jgi:serine/threonine-protein kinase
VETESTELRARLQATLGTSYTLEHELGGGGMSRVFVAADARLDRRVVVKVLPPDRAAGVSARRFEREVRLAARLQHPHIVPLLSAGEIDGLPKATVSDSSPASATRRRTTCCARSSRSARR